MTALVASGLHLPAMPAEAIDAMRRLEGALAELHHGVEPLPRRTCSMLVCTRESSVSRPVSH